MLTKFKSFFYMVLMFICAICMSGIAFAASSINEVVEITKATGSDGETVVYTAADVPNNILLDEETVAELVADGSVADDFSVMWQKDLHADALPVTFNFAISGVADEQDVYVFHYTDEAWHLVYSGKGSSAEVTFDDLSPVGVAVKNVPEKAAATAENESATTENAAENGAVETGDSVFNYIVILGAVAIACVLCFALQLRFRKAM